MATQSFINVLIKDYGVKEISSAIAQLRRRLDTIQPILKDIGEIYTENTKYRIETQTAPNGRVWPHNSKVTQRLKTNGIKKSRGYKTFMKQGGGGTFRRSIGYDVVRPPAIEGPNKRLVWTGKLRESIKYRIGGNTVYVISDVPYATTQQFGASKGEFHTSFAETSFIPWGDIPARPFLGSNKRANEKVSSRLGEYLLGNKIAKQLGFSS
jgi:phage gpG-like protein